MTCPRCKQKLTKMETNNLELDVCFGGCGGIWFDWLELKKLDEAHEADLDFLNKLSVSRERSVDTELRINCLKCDEITMIRHFFSVKRKVEVDECGKCGGFWLDCGELTEIVKEYPTEAARKAEASKVFSQMFGANLEKLKEAEQGSAIHKVSQALKLISPSYYLRSNDDDE